MRKKVKKMVMGMVMFLGIIGLTGCGGKVVDLNEYVQVQITGIDTKGQAEVVVNNNDLESKLAEMMDVKIEDEDIENLEDMGEALLGMDKIDRAMNCFTFIVNPMENLKNGDEISVTANIDEQIAKELGIKFKFKDISMKVEGLQEAIVITQEELFKDVVVEFTGTAPEAKAQIRNTSDDEIISKIKFGIDKDYGLNIGEKIVVQASNTEDFMGDGYVFEDTSKEYTVDKVDTYITDFSQMTEESLTKIVGHAKDMISAQLMLKKVDESFYEGDSFKGSMNFFDSITEPQLEPSYFYNVKKGLEVGRGGTYNALGITYSFDVTGIRDGFSLGKAGDYSDCRIMILCTNMIIDKNGEVKYDINNMEFTKGYSAFDTMYLEEVEATKADFEITEVDLKKYY